MAILKNNVLFIYRNGDDDSLKLANYYKNVYDLDDDQIYGIDCSNIEILPDYTTFLTEVEQPIELGIIATTKNIYVIVLGYNIPGGFLDVNDVVSATSRISKIGHLFNKQLLSVLYDRKIFKRFDSEDAKEAIVCSRIDAPTYELSRQIIDEGSVFQNQHTANGRFYIDPYTTQYISNESIYRSDILYFINNTISKLNLEVVSTSGQDPYVDVIFPFLTHDSFYWGWFQDRSSLSFFKSPDTSRIFFYNADYDSGTSIRNVNSDTWCQLALQGGYLSFAGSMSNPSIDGFIRPTPFFNSLLYGSTLGEAYLFANPYYDWTISMFGDPLITVAFSANSSITKSGGSVQIVNQVDEYELWRQLSIGLSRSVAHQYRKELEALDILNTIVYSTDVQTELDLLYPANTMYGKTNEDYRKSLFGKAIENLFLIIPERFGTGSLINSIYPNKISYDSYLQLENLKVSKLLLESTQANIIVSNSNTYEEGYWELEFVMNNEVPYAVEFYHFEIEVSDQKDFSNILFFIDSLSDQTNWQYEKEKNEFVQLPTTGVRSNYSGRRIRYKSKISEYDNELLSRGSIYYFRYRQKDSTFTFQWNYKEDIIYT